MNNQPLDVYHDLKILFYAGFIIITTIAAWVTAYRMRKKMKKALGRNLSEVELTSINAWMRVAESEKNAKEERDGGTLGPPLL
jgi:hypothetical protein